MKTLIRFLFVIAYLSLIITCSKTEEDYSTEMGKNQDELTLKSAKSNTDMIPITKTTPDGKVIIITVPANAVESILKESPKLPYSPEGVYVFYNQKQQVYYDVFITYFDGDKFLGTCCYPSGGPYEYIGKIDGGENGYISCNEMFHGFSGRIEFIEKHPIVFNFITNFSDGIIGFVSPSVLNVITVPYSPEGVYGICEYDDTGIKDRNHIISYITIYITSFDGVNFEGVFTTTDCLVGDIAGFVFDKNISGGLCFTAYLHYTEVKSIKVEGIVSYLDGITSFIDPYGFLPPSIIVVENN